ncbi:unnamed protein product [Gongylonema pulchrum]|uniref:RWD domain-containing protein n=1 Tax=Gongylonema pulchrum TaxID=637853 RepID=A0A183CZZ3_9BILA|nr:unnamed protein product [Gongylonema pulchrum]
MCSPKPLKSMVEQEMEVLKSIYGDELVIEETPDSADSQAVLNLRIQPSVQDRTCAPSIRAVIELPHQYPDVAPRVHFQLPRGVDEENLNTLRDRISEFLREHLGVTIVFDVFEMIRDFLATQQSIPCAVCPICLRKFSEAVASVCTSTCDHYFHHQCLVEHIEQSKKQIQDWLRQMPDMLHSKIDRVRISPVSVIHLFIRCSLTD